MSILASPRVGVVVTAMIVVGLLGPLAVANGQAKSSCDAALVKNVERYESRDRLKMSLFQLIDEQTYNEMKRDGSLKVIFKGVPVGANYSEFRQSFQRSL